MAATRDATEVALLFTRVFRRHGLPFARWRRITYSRDPNIVCAAGNALNPLGVWCRSMSSTPQYREPKEKDSFAVFTQPQVQSILTQITGFDIDRIFKVRPVPMQAPKYKLLTTEQVEALQSDMVARARKLLQMPPLMAARLGRELVLQQDPKLEGYDTAKYVFTDITFNVPDRNRVVVIREPDGTLRRATAAETDRMSQVYNPNLAQEGRSIIMPPMFEGQLLEDILDRGEYEYILDRACVQFEPDTEDYIRVTHRVYAHILTKKAFDSLRSTRHFGPMAFYYAWHGKIDYLLIDMVQRDLVADGAGLVRLFCIIHPDTATHQQLQGFHSAQELDVIKVFAQCDSHSGDVVQLAVQSYEDAKKHENKAVHS